MSGITLKVNTEVLEKKAQEVDTIIGELEQHFKDIQGIVEKSTGYWEGNAGDKARKAFLDQKSNAETVIKRLQEHPTELLVMAGVYEQAEESLVLVNQTLDTDVIV